MGATQVNHDQEMEAVLRRIERAVRRAKGFALGFVRCNLPVGCSEACAALRARLAPGRVLEVHMDESTVSVLDELKLRLDPQELPLAVFVFGLERAIAQGQDDSPVLGRLNHDRDLLRRAVPVPLLFWLPDFALGCVARGAPDFWAWRSGVYAVPESLDQDQTSASEALSGTGFRSGALSADEMQGEMARLESLIEASRSLSGRTSEDREREGDLLVRAADLALSLGRMEDVRRLLSEASAAYAATGSVRGQAITRHQMGVLAEMQGDLEEARRLYGESLRLRQELGDKGGIGVTLHQTGTLAHIQGDLEEARRLYGQALGIFQELGDKSGVAATLHQMGVLAHRQGDLEEARRLFGESLRLAQELGDKRGMAITLWAIGLTREREGDLRGALSAYAQSWRLFDQLQSPNRGELEALLAGLRDRVGDAQLNAWAEALGVRLPEALSEKTDAPAEQAAAPA